MISRFAANTIPRPFLLEWGKNISAQGLGMINDPKNGQDALCFLIDYCTQPHPFNGMTTRAQVHS
jgi:hypothetical protein